MTPLRGKISQFIFINSQRGNLCQSESFWASDLWVHVCPPTEAKKVCVWPDEKSWGLDLHILTAAHFPGQQHQGVQDVVTLLGARLHEDGTETNSCVKMTILTRLLHCRGRGVATPAILFPKEPAQASKASTCSCAGSLWHKKSWLPCTERINYRRPFVINNQ